MKNQIYDELSKEIASSKKEPKNEKLNKFFGGAACFIIFLAICLIGLMCIPPGDLAIREQRSYDSQINFILFWTGVLEGILLVLYFLLSIICPGQRPEPSEEEINNVTEKEICELAQQKLEKTEKLQKVVNDRITALEDITRPF